MKKAVMMGAGCIGRGFIGQLLHDSGYEVIFVDIDGELARALERERGYTLRVVGGQVDRSVRVQGVRAIDAADAASVARAIAECDLMAISVRKENQPSAAPNIAAGILARSWLADKPPLNIMICENIAHSSGYLRELLLPCFAPEDQHLLNTVGLVETMVDRMVPRPTQEMRKQDVSFILVEPFRSLAVDKVAFKGGMPDLVDVETFTPFTFFEEKKLFIHNMGHASCAYLGYIKGHEYVWQAAEDQEIRRVILCAMRAAAQAVAAHYSADLAELLRFADELLDRFANRLLGDTIARVAADPMRKLQPGDRLVGSVKRCRAQGIDCDAILRGIAAALGYRGYPDPSVEELEWRLRAKGPEEFLQTVCGLDAYECAGVMAYYREPELLFI